VTQRLFVAAALDEDARAACADAAARLRATGFHGTWVPPENYHLTVAFLGGVDDARLADISGAVSDAAVFVSPVDVPIDALGAFPDERRPRVAWAGPSAPIPGFGLLSDAVRGSLAAMGFVFPGRGDAHVTLARADARTPLPRADPPQGASVRIDELILYRSLSEPAGVRYEPLERFALGA
jgi:2'-5' RNA ligase